MTMHDRGLHDFLQQARTIRASGSPFVAALLEAGHRQLAAAPQTAALVAEWPGDRASAALAMRFNGALHALSRGGRSPELRGLYDHEHQDFDGAIGAILAAEDDFIAAWMRDPPQTNEVGRAAAIMAALLVARDAIDASFAMLELGSSAGLNLNLAHYDYDIGGQAAGVAGSPVMIRPEWTGAAPPEGVVRISGARGVDLRPLDMADDAARERLMAFAWTDEPARAARLEQAIGIARTHPPRIDRAAIIDWLPARLAEPQPEGEWRVIFHSMVLQYLPPAERDAIAAIIGDAGARADNARPLAWIGYEWTECRSEVRLMLTCWPGGTTRHLATCHPYGAWIHWHGDMGRRDA